MDKQRRHVVEHYPVERLPEDLRGNFPAEGHVTVIVEPEAHPDHRSLMEIIESAKHLRRRDIDPVGQVREGRDDSSREELHDRIRRGEAD